MRNRLIFDHSIDLTLMVAIMVANTLAITDIQEANLQLLFKSNRVPQ
jgi:hypothetical protein